MNNFKFNGTNYLQIGGTAMGTRVALSYANIFLSNFEDKYIYSYHLQPLVWYRYIDDVFCIWQHDKTELKDFVKHLNTVHGTTKFMTESSQTESSFLDTMVKLNDGDISTDLYCKPTDMNNYLPYDLAHPPHCKKGLPYSQFLRLRRICSRDEDFLTNSAKKAAFLLQIPCKQTDRSLPTGRGEREVSIPETQGDPEKRKQSCMYWSFQTGTENLGPTRSGFQHMGPP